MRLLDDYYWKVAGELLPTNYPYQPWVDSLKFDTYDRTQEINNYLALVDTCPGKDAPVWQKYRLATRYLIFHLLKSGKSKIEIVRLLDDMAIYEKTWIIRHKDHYKFSAEILQAAAK